MKKIFNVGEYGFEPFYKLTITDTGVVVEAMDSKHEVKNEQFYAFSAISNLEMWLWDQTSSYYTDNMIDWIKSTAQYKKTPKADPFTTFTFMS